jgi:hypothetical protein
MLTDIWAGESEVGKKGLMSCSWKNNMQLFVEKKYHMRMWSGFHWLAVGENEQP